MTQTEEATVLVGLKRQQECVRQLAALCRQQRQLVDSGDAEGLLRLLGRRQGLIRELEDAEKEVAGFKAGWPHTRDDLPASDRPRVEQLLAEIEACLKQIIEQDEQDYRQLAGAKEQVGRQLRHAAVGRQVNAAYAAQSGGRPLPGHGDTA